MILGLPLYVDINLALLTLSILLCFFIWLIGLCSAPLLRKNQHNLPPITLYSGSAFPTWLDQGYTILFILFFAWQSGFAHFSEGGQELFQEGSEYEWTMVLFNLLIYVPMLVRYATLPRWEKPRLGRGRAILIIFAGLFCVYFTTGMLELSGLLHLISAKTGAPMLQPVLELLLHGDTPTRICLILSAVIIAPICEECCFRGFLYNVLKRTGGVFAATIATGLVFASIHTALLQFIPLAVFGWVMCIVYERTRRLWIPIVIHMIFNAVSTLVLLLVGAPV